jgi:uncharacterized protein YegL
LWLSTTRPGWYAGSPTIQRGSDGLERAELELDQQGRAEARPAIILFTDGQVDVGSEAERDALDAANRLRARQVRLATVGVGGAANEVLLRAMAWQPSLYYHAPGPAELDEIYRVIAGALLCRDGT